MARRELMVTLAVGVVLAGCARGGDDQEQAAQGERQPVGEAQALPSDLAEPLGDGSATVTPPRRQEPSLADPAGASDVVEARVIEANELIDELLQEPEAGLDPNEPRLLRLRQLYNPESPIPDALASEMATMRSLGQRVGPGPSGLLRELGVYDTTVIDDRIVFYVCSVEDFEVVDAAGGLVRSQARIFHGQGIAEWIDGRWQLDAIVPVKDLIQPLMPGEAEADMCDKLAAAAAAIEEEEGG